MTVIVEAPLPAVSDGGAAETVDSEGEMLPPPEPGAGWQPALPVSLKVLPATGTNFHA
jgi:hypothetical protein